MAAINFTPISLYYTTTAAAVPSAGNLVSGELALNITDEKLYFKNAAGTVKLLASNAATAAGVDSFSGGTTGLTPSTATTGAVTLAGTLAVANGGTNLTSFTSGGVVYASSSSALATGSVLTLGGTALGVNGTNANITIDGGGVGGIGNALGVTGTSNGYVGTTTNTPLYVISNNSTRISISPTTTTLYGSIYIANADATNELTFSGTQFTNLLSESSSGFQLGTTGAGYLDLLTSNATRFRIGSSGQFGIGGATYGSAGDVLTSGGSGAAPTWTTPAAGVSLSANNTWTGTQTFNGTSSVLAAVLANTAETANIIAGTNNANSTAYFNTGSVIYYTTSNNSNWTQNLTFSSGTTLNSAMSTGQSITMAILSSNGGTAYYPNAFQVDGNSVTPRWQGGTAPTSGNASSVDIYTYTIIKLGSASFAVFASQTKFA